MDAKPCPFCGESAAAVSYYGVIGPRFVKCDKCGARGPEMIVRPSVSIIADVCACEERAIAAWNERAGEMAAADFEEWWMRTPIPAEYDSWDDCARQQWRAVCKSAFEAGGHRRMPAELRSLIDCWRINYGLDRGKVEAARRWAEAGGPPDGAIMALATAIEWLERLTPSKR